VFLDVCLEATGAAMPQHGRSPACCTEFATQGLTGVVLGHPDAAMAAPLNTSERQTRPPPRRVHPVRDDFLGDE
jgi:hypothetical protein